VAAEGATPLVLTLLARTYCHLCEDMERALGPLLAEFRAALEVVDVDTSPALESRWGDKVPVLLHRERELCHYFLDAQAVRAYLAAVR
jgi:hypothetical protein